VVVDNKPGAGGQIAAQLLKAAKPDGLTLYLSNSHTMAMIPLTVLNPGYDAAKDFTPIGLVAVNPDVFVINPSVVGNPKAGLREFAQWAKGHPTAATWACRHRPARPTSPSASWPRRWTPTCARCPTAATRRWCRT
jgi:tripartite-type tricarboxylate transporter receptor subunit TctC